jgi:hypothetical protein
MRKLIESQNHLLWECHDVTCTGSNNAFAKYLPLIFLGYTPSRREYHRFVGSKNIAFCSSFMSLDPPTNLRDSIFFLAFMFDDVGTMVKNCNDGRGISTSTKNFVEKYPENRSFVLQPVGRLTRFWSKENWGVSFDHRVLSSIRVGLSRKHIRMFI